MKYVHADTFDTPHYEAVVTHVPYDQLLTDGETVMAEIRNPDDRHSLVYCGIATVEIAIDGQTILNYKEGLEARTKGVDEL